MANYWNKTNIPHKGWNLIDVIDIREEGQSEEDTEYETCMMCNNERIRYVHILSHTDVPEVFRVGCICAENMTSDYVNPKKREKELKNKANRRRNWIKKNWNINSNGNFYLRTNGHYILIYKSNSSHNKYKVKFDDNWGSKEFDTLNNAKIAVFKYIESLKSKNEW